MGKQEKIKIAITAGIAAVILLIFVLVLAFSGNKNTDEDKLNDSISEYAQDKASVNEAGDKTLIDGAVQADVSSNSSEESSESAAIESSVSEYLESKNTAKNSVSGNSFYATNTAVLKDNYKGLKFNITEQLAEMFGHWSQGNTEAVRDLAHLERFEAMSYSLNGTNDFYYYGDTTSDGKPSGTGVAVYANDQYYYGEWSDGKRSGNGTWISFYPDYSTYVVTEHLYAGTWANDLPNGDGQEHYDYNYEFMNAEDIYLQNAIGSFKDGYYNGEMYIITVNNSGDTKEWIGTCTEGLWEQVDYTTIDQKGNIPVLSERENSDNHIYMSSKGIKDNGVSGIITGGNPVG